MPNKRLILALTGAVICGLLAVLMVTRYLASVQAFTKDVNNVVVAKVEIPLGAKITVEQLGLAPIPNGSAPEGAFRKVETEPDMSHWPASIRALADRRLPKPAQAA